MLVLVMVSYTQDGTVTRHQPLALLSASTDKMMMLWRPDPHSQVWLNDVRVGTAGTTFLLIA